VQLNGPCCVGLGSDVVGVGVYTYVHVHCEVVCVDPVTVDEKVCTVPAITVAVLGDTVSTTVFAPEPLHPLCHAVAPASASIAAVFIVRNFMNHISLVSSARVTTHATSSIFVSPFDGLKSFSRCPA
jgi:hypothetical protein